MALEYWSGDEYDGWAKEAVYVCTYTDKNTIFFSYCGTLEILGDV
jgi:hypothetical protein